MKDLFKFMSFMLVLGLAMAACKDPEPEPEPEDTTPSYSVIINGQEYNSFPFKQA